MLRYWGLTAEPQGVSRTNTQPYQMKVSEKSLELNVGAELLGLLRTRAGMPKAYLRGLTQLEEKQQGVDFFAQLSPSATILAFQFKAPMGSIEASPYRYTLRREQHDLLYGLARNSPGSVFYVLPFYITPAKLHRDVPNLVWDTWLLRVAQMQTLAVFRGQSTKVIRCSPGSALINPEYKLEKLSEISPRVFVGISAQKFAEWYEDHRRIDHQINKRRSPWLVRGLRLVVVEPSPG